jgi:hypothetical protein
LLLFLTSPIALSTSSSVTLSSESAAACRMSSSSIISSSVWRRSALNCFCFSRGSVICSRSPSIGAARW